MKLWYIYGTKYLHDLNILMICGIAEKLLFRPIEYIAGYFFKYTWCFSAPGTHVIRALMHTHPSSLSPEHRSSLSGRSEPFSRPADDRCAPVAPLAPESLQTPSPALYQQAPAAQTQRESSKHGFIYPILPSIRPCFFSRRLIFRI